LLPGCSAFLPWASPLLQSLIRVAGSTLIGQVRPSCARSRSRVFPSSPSPQICWDSRSSSRGVSCPPESVRRSTVRFARPRSDPRGPAAAIHQQAFLVTQTCSLEISSPFSVTSPERPVHCGVTSPPDPPSGFLNLLTACAASGLRGLVSCRLRSQDSPLRAFPIQKAVLLSKPLLPCGWALARAFALGSGRHSPASISSVYPAVALRLVPLEKGLFVYRFPDAVFPPGQPSASSSPKPCSSRPPHRFRR
jgi:hypothetical protein